MSDHKGLWSRWLRRTGSRDVEELHELALHLSRGASYIPGLLPLFGGGRVRSTQPIRLGELTFANPVGLAAGFDKNADWLDLLPAFGFGFAEIGTVTPRPQGGNPRPRLFRDTETQTIRNRMGFNNLGAEVISRKLARQRDRGRIPADFRVGVNVGKNRATELSDAPSDYVQAVSRFRDLADFAVINVSSPNTPGLRSLQESEALASIVGGCRTEIAKWSKPCPLWVKLAPEFCAELQADEASLHDFLARVSASGIQGWVLTNTLASPDGGLSGLPVQSHARRALIAFRSQTNLPIISVGGILDSIEAQSRMDLGAQLLEVYSGWVFGGPRFVARLARELKL